MRQRFPNIPIGRFEAAAARSLGFNITPDPAGDPDGSPEHVLLTASDVERSRNQHQRACRTLAKRTEFLSFEQFCALS
jgi:hypothetical protein